MNWEYSCGAVVFTRIDDEIKYVLVQSISRHIYGFPKGHMEQGETELETAKREVWEETHLRPVFVEGFRAEEDRPVPSKKDTMKHVVYFLAEYKDQEIIPQAIECASAPLVSYEQACEMLPNGNLINILSSAKRFIEENLL